MNGLQTMVVALSFFLIGCSPPQVESPPLVPIIEADVIGTWELKYAGKTIFDKTSGTWVYGKGVERITLLPTGRYEQTFDDGAGGSFPKTESGWKLARNYSGSQVVILDGLRKYKDGVAAAIASTPPQSTTLLVETTSPIPFGFGKTKELILCFDEADVNLCFSRLLKSTP